jgi:hypothetical protein
MTDPTEPLPTLVQVTEAFSARLPTQRVLDLIARVEPDTSFGELATHQPFRLVAFRALMRDHPDRDPASLWLHAYDTEVEMIQPDPTNGATPTPWPVSAPITG